jgi:hypothetical protein
MRIVSGLIVLLLAACASEPGVVPAGQDTYMASRSGKFYVSMTEVRAGVLKEVGDFCEKRNMTFAVISTSSTQPPYVVGNNPEIEVQFRCVSHDATVSVAEKSDH